MCTAEPLRGGSFGAGVSIGLLAADGLRSPDAPTACVRCSDGLCTVLRRLAHGVPTACARCLAACVWVSGGLCSALRWLAHGVWRLAYGILMACARCPRRSRCGVPLLMHAVVAAFACRLCGFPQPCRRFRMSTLRTGKRRRCFRVPALQRSGGVPIGGQPCPYPNNAFKII